MMKLLLICVCVHLIVVVVTLFSSLFSLLLSRDDLQLNMIGNNFFPLFMNGVRLTILLNLPFCLYLMFIPTVLCFPSIS